MELCDYQVTRLAQMLRQREISAFDLMESVFERIDAREKMLNAYITLTREMALKQATAADHRFQIGQPLSMLDGIPIAIKDNLCTQGIRTTCGSKILENYIPPYDATAVQRITSDGAILVGKTNLDEFGMGSSCENSAYGPTRNPINPDYVAGGSSGGSAASVASGESIIALGTDTGGSIRIPAAYCGIAGIKPTYGRVSRYGLVSYASSLDQIGAFGKSVEDCALLLNSICGHDHRDSTAANVLTPDFLAAINRDIKGLKIGLPVEYFVEGLDESMKELIMQAVNLLAEHGAEIEEISLPHTKYAISTYYIIATAEASSNLARYDGVKYGFRTHQEIKDLVQMYEETRSQGFGKEVKRRIMLGSYVLSAGYFDAYYRKAQQVRALIKQDFDQAFQKVDCIIGPVSPSLPFKLGEKIAEPLLMYLVDIYTVSLNLAGLPGLCLNCGAIDNLPVGFQIIGKSFDEETILRVGHFYETIKRESI